MARVEARCRFVDRVYKDGVRPDLVRQCQAVTKRPIEEESPETLPLVRASNREPPD